MKLLCVGDVHTNIGALKNLTDRFSLKAFFLAISKRGELKSTPVILYPNLLRKNTCEPVPQEKSNTVLISCLHNNFSITLFVVSVLFVMLCASKNSGNFLYSRGSPNSFFSTLD